MKNKHCLLSPHIWFYFANKLCCHTHTHTDTHKTQKFHFKNCSILKWITEFGWELHVNWPYFPVVGSFALNISFNLILEALQVTHSLSLEAFRVFNFAFNNLQFPHNISWGFILHSMGLMNLEMLTFSQGGIILSPGNLNMLIIQKSPKHAVRKWKEFMTLKRKLESLPCTESHGGSTHGDKETQRTTPRPKRGLWWVSGDKASVEPWRL